jgi:poly(A) polymerase
VRDLLLGIEPKDFDVATDARPEQVKPLFPARIHHRPAVPAGHVHIGTEPIEVSTFRAAQTGEDATDEHGRLISDNVYGSQAEDAARPRFHDQRALLRPGDRGECGTYVGGITDIRFARLRLIGSARDAVARGSGAHAARGALAAKLGVRSIRRPRRRYPVSRR